MGSSKGSASPERKTHRNAAVLRRQAGETHHVVAERGNKTITFDERRPTLRPPPPAPLVVAGEWPPDTEPRPTSEQRAYFWRLTFGAIKALCVIVAGLILALVLGVGLLIVSKGA